MKFSERIGLFSVKTQIQYEEMNDELRNSLWNILDTFFWNRQGFLKKSHSKQQDIFKLSRFIWMNFFKMPVDLIPGNAHEIIKQIRNYFFTCEWFGVYDFLEFVIEYSENINFTRALNHILERELSGYRLIDSSFVPVTDEIEVEAIQSALTDGPFIGVQAHLKQALKHLSRRENPDYRNSIKESISAVESMAQEMTGNPKASLGEALKQLERTNRLHGSLKKGFSAIYGYTSGEDGIRHAMLSEPDISVNDAKFFLISCASFINYLKSKIA